MTLFYIVIGLFVLVCAGKMYVDEKDANKWRELQRNKVTE